MSQRMNWAEAFVAKLQFGSAKRLEFYKQLMTLTRTGVSKTDAIEMTYKVASQMGRKPKDGIAPILKDVLLSMHNGRTLGRALAPWVPKDDVMILEAIENSESFANNLEDYLELAQKKKKIKGSIIGGSIYPIALISSIYGMMIYFGTAIVPQIGLVLPVEEWQGAAGVLAAMSTFANEYAAITTISIVAFFLLIMFTLPRWTGFGRRFADKLPIYSTYRIYTGLSFLMSMAALMKGGTSSIDAINRIKPNSNAYIASRIRPIERRVLDGDNLGAAMDGAGTQWPDKTMNLSIRVYAETKDLPKQLTALAKSWVDDASIKIDKTMGSAKVVAMLITFGCIILIVGGMFTIQGQIANSVSY